MNNPFPPELNEVDFYRLLLREFSEYADAIRFQAKIAEITQLAPVPGFERVSE